MRPHTNWILPLLSLCLLSVICGAEEKPLSSQPEKSPEKTSVLPLEDLRVFTRAYEHIRSSYIEEIDDAKLLQYAIKGMLEELDPHSAYLDASSFDDLQVNTTGEFGGLGIEVGMEDGFVKVVSPIDDTPAAKAGVEAGDLIIKLDGETVKGLTLNQAVDKMRGPKGSDITITIVREGTEQPFDLTLTRDIVTVRSVRSDILEDDIAYLRIAQFQINTGRDAAKEIEKLLKLKPQLSGMILDLRNNPGGVLNASVEVADLFLDGGLIVYTEGRLKNSSTEYKANPGDVLFGLPIIVLINDGSASASEIVAGALQDQQRALLLGIRSFGKGSVQSVIPVANDRAIKLTTALYYTPSGRSIQAQGIEPDIEVERVRVTAVKQRRGVSEADLNGHLDNGNGGNSMRSQERNKEGTSDLLDKDSQLYEAINLIKGAHLLKRKPSPLLSKPIKDTKDEG